MFNKYLKVNDCLIVNILFIFIYIGYALGLDFTSLSPTLGKANMVNEAMAGVVSETDKSTNFFVSVVNFVGGYNSANFINFLISFFYINYCIFHNRYLPFQLFWILVLLASIVLFLRIPHKEIMLVLPYFMIYFFYQYFGKKEKIVIFLLITYLITYGFYARTYFLLITLMYFIFFIYSKISLIQRYFFSLFLVIIFFLIPLEILYSVQITRDLSSAYRIANSSWDGFRTAFVNFLEITSHINFIINYVYAFLRLNLPIFFDFTFKEVLHTIITLSTFYIVFFKKINFEIINKSFVKQIRCFIAAHMFTLWLFEPDLGSYLRHLLSYYPLLLFFTLNFFQEHKTNYIKK